MLRNVMMETQQTVMAVMPCANPSVEMEWLVLVRNATMVLPTPMLFLMPAEITAGDQDVEMEFVIPTSNAILVPTLLNANHALLDAEMVSWSLERSVITESTTPTINPTLAVLTADCHGVVMEFLTAWKSVTTEPTMETLLTSAEHGAEFPSVETELLIAETRKLVTMETCWMVMDATLAANSSVEMAVLTLVNNVIMVLTTLTPSLLAVELTAHSQHVATV